MKPSAIQDAVAAVLAARYPTFTVEPHGGQFTEREVPMLLAKAPAILVACTGFASLHATGLNQWRGVLRWAAFVLGADTATTERQDVALDTVADLWLWLPGQRWGLAEARVPEQASLAADNLYTGSLNNLRIALWGLRWEQTFTFTVS
jgi:hypothetical protein